MAEVASAFTEKTLQCKVPAIFTDKIKFVTKCLILISNFICFHLNNDKFPINRRTVTRTGSSPPVNKNSTLKRASKTNQPDARRWILFCKNQSNYAHYCLPSWSAARRRRLPDSDAIVPPAKPEVRVPFIVFFCVCYFFDWVIALK